MSCKLCGFSGRPQPLFFGIVQCPQCTLAYYSEGVDTKKLYSSEYFSGGEYHDYGADKGILQKNFSGRMEYLKRLHPRGRLLEVGCAYGFFLELAAKNYDVQGIDISEDGVKHAKEKLGLPARAGDFLEFPDEKNAFDLACMWDTIEHLSEPFAYLKKISKWIKPGGHLVLTTGDFGSLLAKFRGKKWRQIHPPTHLFYFDRKTLAKALEQAGFDVTEFATVGQYRSYKSMMYGLFRLRHPKLSALYSVLTLGEHLNFPLYLNTLDIVQVTARKR